MHVAMQLKSYLSKIPLSWKNKSTNFDLNASKGIMYESIIVIINYTTFKLIGNHEFVISSMYIFNTWLEIQSSIYCKRKSTLTRYWRCRYVNALVPEHILATVYPCNTYAINWYFLCLMFVLRLDAITNTIHTPWLDYYLHHREKGIIDECLSNKQ